MDMARLRHRRGAIFFYTAVVVAALLFAYFFWTVANLQSQVSANVEANEARDVQIENLTGYIEILCDPDTEPTAPNAEEECAAILALVEESNEELPPVEPPPEPIVVVGPEGRQGRQGDPGPSCVQEFGFELCRGEKGDKGDPEPDDPDPDDPEPDDPDPNDPESEDVEIQEPEEQEPEIQEPEEQEPEIQEDEIQGTVTSIECVEDAEGNFLLRFTFSDSEITVDWDIPDRFCRPDRVEE